MASPNDFMGSISIWAPNFAPRDWAFCAGQLLSISQYDALYSIIGTTFGGDGVTTFALPDFRGRAAVGTGQGPGLPAVVLGEKAGTNNVTLTISQMPAHNHMIVCNDSAAGTDTIASPTNNYPAQNQDGTGNYATTSDGSDLNPQSISVEGGNQPFSIMQPYLGLNFIIALYGIYPSRN